MRNARENERSLEPDCRHVNVENNKTATCPLSIFSVPQWLCG